MSLLATFVVGLLFVAQVFGIQSSNSLGKAGQILAEKHDNALARDKPFILSDQQRAFMEKLRATRSKDAAAGKTDDSEVQESYEPQKWPELVGWDYERAVEYLKAQYPDFTVQPVRNDYMVTMDFDTSRVRVFYDPETNQVDRAPMVG